MAASDDAPAPAPAPGSPERVRLEVARPATGLTVAFTILVVGEEDRRKTMNALRRLLRDVLIFYPRPSKETSARRLRGQGGPMWDKPTRVTLARYAYPGLIGVAINFNRRMLWLVLFLLSSLALTSETSPDPEDVNVRRRGTEEMARIVTLVVGTSFLPLAYGMLGAGAAVVRRLWERMRESMLSPRDSTMALLQLALGGTIGACIGLFINPSGAAPGESKGLLDAWALSGSALSFIAGFGVEGVFRALENFVQRVFRTDEPRSRD